MISFYGAYQLRFFINYYTYSVRVNVFGFKLTSINDLINLRLKPLAEIKEIEILFINKITKAPT